MSCVERPGRDVLGAFVLVLILVLARQIVYTPSWNFFRTSGPLGRVPPGGFIFYEKEVIKYIVFVQ